MPNNIMKHYSFILEWNILTGMREKPKNMRDAMRIGIGDNIRRATGMTPKMFQANPKTKQPLKIQ